MLHKSLWEIDELSDEEYNLWMGWFAVKQKEQEQAAKKNRNKKR